MGIIYSEDFELMFNLFIDAFDISLGKLTSIVSAFDFIYDLSNGVAFKYKVFFYV